LGRTTIFRLKRDATASYSKPPQATRATITRLKPDTTD
jgi:hypothetical protein